MTTPAPAAETTPKRKIWQFSLREMLFAVIAICAILALVGKSRTFRPTPFYRAFDKLELFKSLTKSTGMQFHAGPSSEGTSSNSEYSTRDYQISMESPSSANAGRAVWELQHEIEAQLKKEGCQINGRGTSGDLRSQNLQAFDFRYRHGSTRGIIYVHSFVGQSNEWELFILIHEF